MWLLPMYVKPQEGWVIPYSGKPYIYTSANVQCKLHAHTCFFLASMGERASQATYLWQHTYYAWLPVSYL